PCMAIDDIFIFDNSSVFPDEELAMRVGFIPFITDLKKYTLPEKCDCKSDLGCSHCRAVITLDVSADTSPRTVYSGDLVSEDPSVKPVSPDIVIAKLAPKQAIKFEAYARLGVGNTHAKWQPVSMCVYKHETGGDENGDLFVFTVESTGCLKPEEIVSEAVRILIEKLNTFQEKIKRGEASDEIVEFEVSEEVGRGLYSVGAGDFEEEEGEEPQE
ncbi:MAG: DNA-directed RNA polymerase subunit D, partial [Candidatus Bathyarchaeia archaeon]